MTGQDFIVKAISRSFSVEEVDKIRRNLGITQGLLTNPAFMQKEIKRLQKEGLTNRQIAKRLNLKLKNLLNYIG